MQKIVVLTNKLLIKNGKTIACAESCTSGLISSLLTSISGSSQYFTLGVIAYSNKSKIKILHLPSSIISKYGAVSKETAILMAQNIRKIAKTDLSISSTGIAGPTGATIRKPLGTVFIAVSSKNKTICKKFAFKGTRASIRKQAALKALSLLCAHLSQ